MRRRTRRGLVTAVVVALALQGAIALQARAAAPGPLGSPMVSGSFCSAAAPIRGTGSSFALNAVTNVFIPAYEAACPAGAGLVTYSATGSGAGKAAIASRTHQWGGTDDPLTPDEWATDMADATALRNRVSPVHHIPLAVGAVTVSYNLGSCGVGNEAVSLRSPVLAAMYAGVVKNWNDPLVTADNPGLAACGETVHLVARSDVSGTTFAFKDYLAKRNPEYVPYKQSTLNTAWPAELAGVPVAKGAKNSGVAALVAGTPGAVGYVELSAATAAGLTWAKVDGASLQFNSPAAGTAANCDLAAVGAVTPASTLTPGWDQVSITDTANPVAYAICTFTYALVYNDLATAYGGTLSADQARTLVDFLGIAVDNQGQGNLTSFHYAKLPPTVQLIAQAGLATITYQ